MDRAKYIRVGDKILMFDTSIEHSTMARMVKSEWPGLDPVSAGFVDFDYDKEKQYVVAVCYGKSMSLNLSSQEEDSFLATMMTKKDDWF